MPTQREGGIEISGEFTIDRSAVWRVCVQNENKKWPRGQMASFATQVTENKGVFLKMAGLLSGGVGTVMCFAILAQKGSGKTFSPVVWTL